VGLLNKETGESCSYHHLGKLIRDVTQTFDFPDLQGDVIPSILRDFSAPVKLLPESGIEDEDALAFLAARDTDGFNKWEAGQKLYTSLIFQTMTDGPKRQWNLSWRHLGRTLTSEGTSDYSIQAYALTLPGESTLAEQMDVIDPVGIRKKSWNHARKRSLANLRRNGRHSTQN
jgi:aminopeptidase N